MQIRHGRKVQHHYGIGFQVKAIQIILIIIRSIMARCFLFILIVISCVGCDVPDRKLLIMNSSNDTIYYRLQYDSIIEAKHVKYLQEVYYMKIALVIHLDLHLFEKVIAGII
jgi:hypothetical protein